MGSDNQLVTDTTRRHGAISLPTVTVGLPDLPGALCKNADPEIWFPTALGRAAAVQTELGKRACSPCPARRRCLQWALAAGEPFGIWGGTTPEERVVIRRRQLATALELAKDTA